MVKGILCGAMVARLTSNQKVTGSSPVMENTFALFSQDILMIKVLPLFCEDWKINFSIFQSIVQSFTVSVVVEFSSILFLVLVYSMFCCSRNEIVVSSC